VVSSDHLEPGAVGQIKASVDTTNRMGSLVKHITIYSNDQSRPALSLSISMDVVKK